MSLTCDDARHYAYFAMRSHGRCLHFLLVPFELIV
jgi:hypothetical protein